MGTGGQIWRASPWSPSGGVDVLWLLAELRWVLGVCGNPEEVPLCRVPERAHVCPVCLRGVRLGLFAQTQLCASPIFWSYVWLLRSQAHPEEGGP